MAQLYGEIMKKVTSIILFILLICHPAIAQRLSGSGFGETKEAAKKEALSDLSQTIRVEVKSEFSSITSQKNQTVDELKTKAIHLKSELPILGVEFDELISKKGYLVEAVLHFSNVRLYESELRKIKGLIRKNVSNYNQSTTHAGKVALLATILTDIDQYYKYRIVAQLMHSRKIPEITVTAAEIKNRLKKLEKKADTISFGAKLLARDIQEKRIFVYPPTTTNSSEITQFGSAVKDHLSKYLNTVSTPVAASYFLSGDYQILNNGIELTCRLLDPKGNTLKTAMTYFLPSAYKDYQIKPTTLDFEKLLTSGYIVSGDFKVDIKTEKGRRDLLYRGGDIMRLFVKMNKPGYFYFVIHNLKNEKYSYIVNFTEEQSNRKFVYHINGDYVNKWIELGKFSVVPPFGVETLQLFASTNDIIEGVPPCFHDTTTGLYKLGSKKQGKIQSAESPSTVMTATRGLIMKQKASTAEASLVFTSMGN